MVPNKLRDVTYIAEKYPREFFECHRDGFPLERKLAFVKIVTSILHFGSVKLGIIGDKRFGLNGKRGTDELSADALSFRDDSGKLRVIDFVRDAGGPNLAPAWSEVGGTSKWIQPERFDDSLTNPEPNPEPVPPTSKYNPVHIPDFELADLANRLEKKYGAQLHQGGLARGPVPTFVDQLGASRWRRDYFFNRDQGLSHIEAWKAVNREINRILNYSPEIDPNG